jgi:signal transduction histidine kinase
MAAVAVLTALIAGVVGTALVRTAATATARETLAGQADVVAAQLSDSAVGSGQRIGLGKVQQILAGQGISVVRMGPRGRVQNSDDRAEQAVADAGVAPGATVSTTVTVDGTALLVEARPVNDGAVALVAPLDIGAATRASLQRRVLLALGIGVLTAAVAGWVFARLATRPLRRTAAAAQAMAAGDREVRVQVGGPAEVAEVATAVNGLADALARSEAGQRDFLASVSHDLRTPLAGIAGHADALVDGIVPADEVGQVGMTIRAEAARMERLVSDLLDLARLGSSSFTVEPVPVDLVELLRGMAEVWSARSHAAEVVLHVVTPSGQVLVHTDPRRLRQVLDGLAENALRLLGPGQPLVLELSVEPGAAVLQVRDGGPGLAPEDYPVAFEPGALHARYRGRRPVGAGLGLGLAGQLVARLGGTIEAAPAPEGGAAMTLRLPLPVVQGDPATGPISLSFKRNSL